MVTQSYDDIQTFDALIGRVFYIEDITLGKEKGDYIVRYRGRLKEEDSAKTYQELTEILRPYQVTPLFRWENEQHVILLTKSLPPPKPSNPMVNLALFILTLMSVWFVGAIYGMPENASPDSLWNIPLLIRSGWPFAVSMILILGTHEFSHYLMGRRHGVHVTLPYFIPFPLPPFGTMGAFINMKGIPKNRNQLLDIGIAGPLGGLLVALPVLWIGLRMSHISYLPALPGSTLTLQMEGNSILYLLMKYLAFGRLLPEPVSYASLPPVLYWARYFFTGTPFPWGGMDVSVSPVAWAGWAGLMITGLNLIPAGQLDGGHIFYVLFGKKTAKRFYPIILAILVLLGFFWSGWWFWAVLIFFFGRVYAEPLDQITPLSTPRKILAIFGLLLFVLTFVPVPLINI